MVWGKEPFGWAGIMFRPCWRVAVVFLLLLLGPFSSPCRVAFFRTRRTPQTGRRVGCSGSALQTQCCVRWILHSSVRGAGLEVVLRLSEPVLPCLSVLHKLHSRTTCSPIPFRGPPFGCSRIPMKLALASSCSSLVVLCAVGVQVFRGLSPLPVCRPSTLSPLLAPHDWFLFPPPTPQQRTHLTCTGFEESFKTTRSVWR